MIRTFRHKGLQAFFEGGSKAGIHAAHASRLQRQLIRLDLSKSAKDMSDEEFNAALKRRAWRN